MKKVLFFLCFLSTLIYPKVQKRETSPLNQQLQELSDAKKRDHGFVWCQRTEIDWAVDKNYLLLAQHLVDQGADINQISEWGNPILTEAAFKGFLPMVQWLVEHGADINKVSAPCNSDTALMVAAECGHWHIVEYLIKKGADLTVVGLGGQTFLDNVYHRAAYSGSASMSPWLKDFFQTNYPDRFSIE